MNEMNEMVRNGVRAYANLFDGLKHQCGDISPQ